MGRQSRRGTTAIRHVCAPYPLTAPRSAEILGLVRWRSRRAGRIGALVVTALVLGSLYLIVTATHLDSQRRPVAGLVTSIAPADTGFVNVCVVDAKSRNTVCGRTHAPVDANAELSIAVGLCAQIDVARGVVLSWSHQPCPEPGL